MSKLACPGFRFAGVHAGIKADRQLDLGLIAADDAASAAAVFTRNRVAAAPVALSRAILARTRGRVRGVVVNSGNANACTGPQGLDDARRMAALGREACGGHALVASTGVIGRPLAMDCIERGIGEARAALAPDGFERFAEAIMTTDKRPKLAARDVTLGRRAVRLVGTTKGAGMIAPDMATTLTFVVTDAAIPPPALRSLVAAAVEPTFNAIAVDGDTSTNDTLAVLAGGAAVLSPRHLRTLGAALTDLLDELAHLLIADGEGVHHVVTIEVRGARSPGDAQRVARRIAISPLVKTAIAGADPNWGRILCAVGNAGVDLKPDRIGLAIGGVPVVRRGAGIDGWAPADVVSVMRRPAYTMTIDLGLGRAAARYLACDLSHDYVTINADYTT
ncbi:MAG TPA: bifunctional glutamate N-acetyltransferase/amino-acid acetyltransferase ArgJ [Kofleriaceae bacterium]|nr:bifunctional glutamate N-acetyltransferase/amino-acid acetyltransferase ArgJ [Kofleriaceae bacterium]